jgi:hypothetical protein
MVWVHVDSGEALARAGLNFFRHLPINSQGDVQRRRQVACQKRDPLEFAHRRLDLKGSHSPFQNRRRANQQVPSGQAAFVCPH